MSSILTKVLITTCSKIITVNSMIFNIDFDDNMNRYYNYQHIIFMGNMAENNISGFNVDVQYIHSPYFIIASLGTTSNVLLLIAFVKDPLKCFRNSATYLVMNLSASDTLACIFLAIATLIIPGFTTAFHCFLSGSLLTMTSISFDRYFVVAYPLKYRVLFTRKVIVVWLSINDYDSS